MSWALAVVALGLGVLVGARCWREIGEDDALPPSSHFLLFKVGACAGASLTVASAVADIAFLVLYLWVGVDCLPVVLVGVKATIAFATLCGVCWLGLEVYRWSRMA